MKNLANILTYLRLMCIPMIVLFFYLPFHYCRLIAAVLFAIAAITDWLDGYVARKMHASTRFGAFLDPVADKIIVAVVLVLIVGEQGGLFFTLPACIIITREVLISALREWMAEIGKRTSIAVSAVGKVKTAFQMMALMLLLLYVPSPDSQSGLLYLGGACLYISAALTLWSMFMYVKLAWPDLTYAAKES